VSRLVGCEGVISIVAPAGFGKTTVARQWIAADPRPAAWFTVDEADNDPAVLLAHLAQALGHAVVGAGGEEVPLDARTGLEAARASVAAGPIVVVLDDAHELRSPAALRPLGDLLADLPPGVAVALVARNLPDELHITRRVLATGGLMVGLDELRLDAADAGALVRARRADLSDETVELIVDRADGWAAVLGLAATVIDAGMGPEELRVALTPARGLPLGEYLRLELVDLLDDEARNLLVRTAVLERVNGELADAVLERQGSAAVLERLAAAGDLLVTGFDDGVPWYSYHQVLRDLMLVTLRAEGGDVEVKARLRASAWFESHGDADLAVGQAVAAGATELAAEIVYRNLWAVLNRGQDRTLERWLAGFDEQTLAEIPELALAAAWRSASFGTNEAVRRWLRTAESFAPHHRLADGSTVAEGCAALRVAVVPDGVLTARAAAEFLEQDPSTPWAILARHTHLVARHVLGELEDPSAGLQGIVDDAAGSPTLAALAGGYQVAVLIGFGRIEPALACASSTAGLMAQSQLDRYPMVAPSHAALAMAAAVVGDRSELEGRTALATDALAASSASRFRLAVTRLRLADAWLRAGDGAACRSHLAVARRALDDVGDAVTMVRWADELAERIDGPGAGPGTGTAIVLTAAERRVLHELPTHRSLEEIGTRLYVSRNTVKSHTIAIYRKLGVASRSAAVVEAQRLGLLPEAG
jgi:LuxR family maltose regulon positive regulatory protein